MPAKPKSKLSPTSSDARSRRKLALVSSAARDHKESSFDRLIYERVRLGIMSALAVRDELTFNDLKALFDVSDGNLSAHARKLEDAAYLECVKTFEDRKPKTIYRITDEGRAALHRYLDHVEAVIKATRG